VNTAPRSKDTDNAEAGTAAKAEKERAAKAEERRKAAEKATKEKAKRIKEEQAQERLVRHRGVHTRQSGTGTCVLPGPA
jgi:hypothetical protein